MGDLAEFKRLRVRLAGVRGPSQPRRPRGGGGPGTRWPPTGFENLARTKLGGYPSTIQGETWWELKEHPSRPKYCLQINSEEKAGVIWGDSGALYLARGTAPGCEHEWFLDWQCF